MTMRTSSHFFLESYSFLLLLLTSPFKETGCLSSKSAGSQLVENTVSIFWRKEQQGKRWLVAAFSSRGKQPASQDLHQGGGRKDISRPLGQRTVYPLQGLSRPLLPNGNMPFQAMSSLALNRCGEAILSQVNLKLCWMKNGHSFCKWTAPLCPWLLHPHALQRGSQHCKRSHSNECSDSDLKSLRKDMVGRCVVLHLCHKFKNENFKTTRK